MINRPAACCWSVASGKSSTVSVIYSIFYLVLNEHKYVHLANLESINNQQFNNRKLEAGIEINRNYCLKINWTPLKLMEDVKGLH